MPAAHCRLALGAALLLAAAGTTTVHAQPALSFSPAQQLAHADGDTEPRVSFDPNGAINVISNDQGAAHIWRSIDGGSSYTETSAIANQSVPTIDVDDITLQSGRIVATELDFGGVNFRTSYSDDGGQTWTQSNFATIGQPGPATGTGYADTDRPWLAAGPVDPSTGQQDVYLLFHNLLSGAANHNMYVAKSTDGGASFGAPVPTTLPGQQAFNDLQCADSGGPSDIFVNQTTGRIYAVFGTRSTAPPGGPAGGCGSSLTGSFEINVVAATRVWVATSPDDSPGSWTQSLAVDDNATGQIVGMQLAPGAVDSAGNVYVLYPESPNAYPDYSGAAIKLVHAPGDLSSWSAPVTVAAAQQPGHLLPHIAAGDPGHLGLAYFTGETLPDGTVTWHTDAAQTSNGLDAAPTFSHTRLSGSMVDYTGTASQMMGACGSGPAQGVENGFACGRSTDVWGIAISPVTCQFTVTWPVSSGMNSIDSAKAGTYVATQNGGDNLCTPLAATLGETPLAPGLVLAGAAGAFITGARLRRRSRRAAA